jgi:hypothetical protein
VLAVIYLVLMSSVSSLEAFPAEEQQTTLLILSSSFRELLSSFVHRNVRRTLETVVTVTSTFADFSRASFHVSLECSMFQNSNSS